MAVSGGFTRRFGAVTMRFNDDERGLLTSIAEQVVALVEPDEPADPLVAIVGIDPEAQTPDDPALARLLPEGHRDDPEAAARFRQFTERDLRARKADNARAVIGILAAGGSRLDDAAVASWLGFLNDARLVLGSRLQITDDGEDVLARLGDDDPRRGLVLVYDWLTYLEDSLVRLILPSR